MKPELSIERITPQRALEYLEKTIGNRKLRNEQVVAYAAQMTRGEWRVNNNAITFDSNGNLIDGHHRLYAVVIADIVVTMSVLRGVDPEARFTIDTGVVRDMTDQLIFNKVGYAKLRATYVRAAVRIVTGSPIPIKTMETFNAWYPIFEGGIEAYLTLNAPAHRHMKAGQVAAPLIVAHKLNPDAVEALIVALRDGANLKLSNPAHTLREFLVQEISGERRVRVTSDTVAAKVFSAAKAFIENRSLSKLQASEVATEFFRAPYARGNAGKLAAETRKLRQHAAKVLANVDLNPANYRDEPADASKDKVA